MVGSEIRLPETKSLSSHVEPQASYSLMLIQILIFLEPFFLQSGDKRRKERESTKANHTQSVHRNMCTQKNHSSKLQSEQFWTSL